MCVKSTVISTRQNWLRSIDKGGNSIQSLSATYQYQQGATETGLFSLLAGTRLSEGIHGFSVIL